MFCVHPANKEITVQQAVDYVGSSTRAKKFFYCKGIPLIYWWEVFIACQSANGRTFVCPAHIKDTRNVLVYILKTRCNNPHLDCLIYNMDRKQCSVVKKAAQWENKFEVDPSRCEFDHAELNE